MEGLGSLLLFAALFYFMMRFGCGAHMVHGHGGGRGEHSGHGGHGGHERGPAARDPGYGWYAALIWVPLYNVLSARAAR